MDSSTSEEDDTAPGRQRAPQAHPPAFPPSPTPPAIIRPARGLAAQTLADAVRGGEAGDGDGAAPPAVPIPIPPRVQLEPGGWVGEDAVGATPPGVTAAVSETLGAALAARVARLGQAAGGPPTSSPVESESDGGGGGGAPVVQDGLNGGEAAWWAAASASVYPTAPPPPPADGRASEGALWAAAREGAAALAGAEPVLASSLHACILSQPDLPHALASILTSRLGPDGGGEPGGGSGAPLPTEREAGDCFAAPPVRAALVADVAAAHFRSPDSLGVAQTLLYHSGLHALAAQRLSHALWWHHRRGAALALQARLSVVLGADLHPAATFGPGVLLFSPLGTVVGEAAVLGAGAVLGHAVTLGGTGKASGDRHPKLGSGAQVGSHAAVLGNLRVGAGARVAAAALVVRPVPDGALVAGNPGRLVGLAEEIGWDL